MTAIGLFDKPMVLCEQYSANQAALTVCTDLVRAKNQLLLVELGAAVAVVLAGGVGYLLGRRR